LNPDKFTEFSLEYHLRLVGFELKDWYIWSHAIEKRAKEWLKNNFHFSLWEWLYIPFSQIKIALAHPAASNGVCSRHRSKFRLRKQ
jgi:hypothetical protein